MGFISKLNVIALQNTKKVGENVPIAIGYSGGKDRRRSKGCLTVCSRYGFA